MSELNEKLSDSLRLKSVEKGFFLERHDGRGTYWGIVMTPEEANELYKALLHQSRIERSAKHPDNMDENFGFDIHGRKFWIIH